MERNLLYLILVLILAVVVVSILDSVQNSEPFVAECSAAKDCVDKVHEDCQGSWDCNMGSCVWSCKTEGVECTKDSDCMTTGCSNNICSSKPKFSSCEWKTEYECLKYSSCGCHDNKCAWEQTDDYTDCMASLPAEEYISSR